VDLTALPKVLPVLNQPIPNITAQANADSDSYDLTARFSMKEIDDNVVRFTSQVSNNSRVMDFAMFSNGTPNTRANFLKYVNDGDYNNSFVHRSVPGFVVQGGGYYNSTPEATLTVTSVPTDAPIANEFGVSNTLGTISMAKLGGDPNSATSGWFVSLGDNSENLDNQNGGFTVFARITKDTLASAQTFGNPVQYPIWKLSENPSSPFTNVPLITSFTGGSVADTDLLLFPTVTIVPLPAGQAGESTTLTYSVVGNTNPAVSASVDVNGQLQISYVPDSSGRGIVSVRATDSVGNTVDDNITIEVQRTYDLWRSSVFSVADAADDNISGPDVSNGTALTNMELYLHGRAIAEREDNAVVFSNTKISNSDYPTFSFTFYNLAAGITFAIQESTDLGVTDNWKTVPHTVINQSRSGNIDSMIIRSKSPTTSANTFYRLIFTLTE